MNPEILRAWWFARQGLDSPKRAAASAVLEKCGWARSVGGVNPYLTLFARAGLGREAVDRAIAKQEIHELPSARGCTYVVPSSHFALALKVGQPLGDSQEIALAKKHLGVTELEIKKLEDGVLKALKRGNKDPKELKDDLGSAVRSLGDAGKKRGMSTTLPMVLGRLQSNGHIRRVSVDGRLDNQRYQYALWDPSPLDSNEYDRQHSFKELARLYFNWIGPATLANFQWFTGLGVAASTEAIDKLNLVPIEEGSEYLMPSQEVETLKAFTFPKEEQPALVSGIDSLVLLRRDISAHLDVTDQNQKMQGDRAVYDLGKVHDLSNHAIFDRGRLIGLWEYDYEAEEIAWKTFKPASAGVKRAVRAMETYVREQLGDARSFSLDSPSSRKSRIAFLRKG